MSTRSELVFRANGTISNPFLLCALVSSRVWQLMIAWQRKPTCRDGGLRPSGVGGGST